VIDTSHQPLDGRIHAELIRSMIERGRPPVLGELWEALDTRPPELLQSLARLEANHGFVAHPGTLDAWVIHPFSTTPTLFWVENEVRGWWAPCILCALGVAELVDGPTRVSTKVGGETEPIEIRYDGTVEPSGLLAHFPIKVRDAWANVHRHCASTLVFRTGDEIDAWCERHGVARGEVVPVEQVADLAKAWYGGHLDPGWVKPSAAEAQAVFESVGLTSDHWHVPGGDERF
jgi:hypothetical protein